MFDTFAVRSRSRGLVASLEADRVDPGFEGDGGEADGAAGGSANDATLDDGDGAGAGDAGEGDPEHLAAGDDDDEEFETDDEPDADPKDTVKKLRNALKKAKGKLGKTRADRQLLKELRDAGFRPQDMYADSREFRRLQQAAANNPQLRKLLSGGTDDEPEARTARTSDRRAAGKDPDFTFDESAEALGFDPNESRANRTLADGLKRVAKLEHTLNQTLSKFGNPEELVGRVNRIDQEFAQGRATAIRTEWNTAITAASEHIKDKGQRTVFQDLMLFAREKEGGKRPASFFVNHYLKQLGVNPAQAQRASTAAAAQQRGRVAQNVAGLSRQTAGTNGTPAPARKAKETLADVHKRLRNVAPR